MSFSSAAALLWTASLRNRVLKQLKRLKRPKYLIGALVGGVYFYSLFLRRLSFAAHPDAPSPLVRLLVEGCFTAGVLAALLLQWLAGPNRPSLTFTEAEVQYLFPAPVSRSSLLHYRVARGLLRAGVSALLMTFFIGRAVGARPILFGIGAFIALGTLSLHAAAASLVRTRLVAKGALGGVLRWGGAAAILALLGAAVWVAFGNHPLPPGPHTQKAFEEWVRGLVAEPVLAWPLFPLQTLASLPLSANVPSFLRALPLAAALFAAHYLWLAWLDVPFEEAAVNSLEARARQRAGWVRGGHGRPRRVSLKRSPFALAPRGRPEVALVWKNLTAARRLGVGLPPLVFWLLGGLFVLALLGPGSQELSARFVLLAGVCAAGLLALLGTNSMPIDLRLDLPKLELLKGLPITGRQVLAAEMLAPGVVLALAQAALLVAPVLFTLGTDIPGLPVGTRAALGLALLPFLPAVTFAGLLVQNAAVVLFPAWLPQSGERARGIEALGQRLITFVGTLVVLFLGLLPAALVAGLLGFALQGLLDVWALPFAGCAAAGVLLAEVTLGVVALGKVFDRLDLSNEGSGA